MIGRKRLQCPTLGCPRRVANDWPCCGLDWYWAMPMPLRDELFADLQKGPGLSRITQPPPSVVLTHFEISETS